MLAIWLVLLKDNEPVSMTKLKKDITLMMSFTLNLNQNSIFALLYLFYAIFIVKKSEYKGNYKTDVD